MFIYAHPDDIEFGVAGTAARWARHGAEIVYVLLTDGNVGSHENEMTREALAQVRRQEQEAAGRVAGISQCVFLGYHDGLLEPTLALRKELVRLIRQHRPNVVVCGDPTSFFPTNSRVNHPDHRAAATAAIDAVFPASEMNLLYPDLYEVGLMGHKVNYVYVSNPASEANYYEDISETLGKKIEALRQHVSQLGDWDPEPRLTDWSRQVGQRVGFAHAEAFRRITLKEPTAEDWAG
ncbi:MAG: PIG-L family deacetylase [Ardenticatenales bacterium]|nr:PIG-L family deacetylase [Ardenticatenales bacterium]